MTVVPVAGAALALGALVGALALAPPPPTATATGAAPATDGCPTCVADIAIYDPSYEDDGVWEEEVSAVRSLLSAYGWTYTRLDNDDLGAGALGTSDAPRFRALVAPGGWAATRLRAVGPAGDRAIRDFVANGGGYVGLCAGAYWAADTVSFASRASGGDREYNVESDYRSFAYDLGLYPGTAMGPFGWTPWDGGESASLQVTKIRTSTAPMSAAKMPDKTRFFYAGGPFFPDDEKPDSWQVWAKAVAPSGLPAKAESGDGEPTVVSFRHGEGRVVLFAYHPDVLLDSKVDGVVLRDYYDENDIEWDTGNQSMKEINIASWNIVHAAVQTVLGEPVTPVTRLP